MLHVKNKKIISLIIALLFVFNISGHPIKAVATFINASGIAKLEATTEGESVDENNNEISPLYLPDSTVRLSGLELSPGHVNKKFADYQTKYELTLSQAHTEFTVKPTARFPANVDIQITDNKGVIHPLVSGEVSPAFPAPALDNGFEFQLKLSHRKTGLENTITIKVFRAGTSLELIVNEVENLSDGTKRLKVDAEITPGVNISTVAFAIHFDNTKLQLADSKTNEPIKTGARIYNTVSLQHLDRGGNLVWEDFGFNPNNPIKFGPELNTRGLLFGDFGIADTSETRYNINESNKKFMTIYFKVIDDSFDKDLIKVAPGSIIDGVRIGIYSRDASDTSSYTASNRDMFVLSGLMYTLTKTVRSYDNGTITVSPDKQQYAYGEKITVTATPDRGYEFTEWDKTKIPANMFSEAMKTDPNWHKKSSFQLVMPKADTKVEIRTRTSTGFEKIGEDYDKTQSTLDFTNSYKGEQVIVIGDPYEVDNTFNGEPDNSRRVISSNIQNNNPILVNKNTDTDDKVNTYTRTVGTEKVFKTLQNTSTETYTDKNFVLKSNGINTKIWIDKTKQQQYSDQEILQMQGLFDANYTVIKNKFGKMYDTDSDGKLNILIYDIPAANSYLSLGELTGTSGNRADIIHLSSSLNGVNTSVQTLSKNMAFESQKISLMTTFESEFASLTKAKYDSMMPKWIEAGLSMMAIKLTGHQMDDVISLFNSSERVRSGQVSLTQWEETPENYALSYLFFSYIAAHTNDDILKNFYKSYAPVKVSPTQIEINNAIKDNFMEVLNTIPVFAGLNFKLFHENFRIATYINSKTGLYGFNNKQEFSMLMAPISNDNLFDGYDNSIKSGAAIVVATGGDNIRTSIEDKVTIVGATLTQKILTVTPSVGGNVSKTPNKTSYNKNEKVTLTATPDKGYLFSHWKGTDKDGVKDATINIVMNEDKTYTPVFTAITQYTVSYVPNTNGRITIRDSDGAELQQTSNSVTVYEGDEITIIAEGVGDYYFDGWTGDYTGTKDDFILKLTINKDMNLIPHFRPGVVYDINYNIIPNNTPPNASFYAVVKDTDGNIIDTNPKKLLEGSVLHLGDITLKEHWNFVKWTINGIDYFNKEVAIEVTGDVSITLEIVETEKVEIKEPEKNFYDGSMVITDTNGNPISFNEALYLGTEIVYTATPTEGYKFLRWQIKKSNKSNESNELNSYSSIDLTQNPITVKLVKGEELLPVFAEKSIIELTDPSIGAIDIRTGASNKTRQLVRLENGLATDGRFDQHHTKYNLYLKSDDVDVKLDVGIYPVYSDVTLQFNDEKPIEIIKGMAYHSIDDTVNTIKIKVKGNTANNNEDKTTEYVINVIRIAEDKKPTINIQYSLMKDTDYKLKVNLRNTAFLTGQFHLALPGGTKLLGVDGKEYDMNISENDFLTYILANDVAADFKISKIIHKYDVAIDSEVLMIAFQKKPQNIPEVYNGTPFSFDIRLPAGKSFANNPILNYNSYGSMISDYRFPIEALDYIYFIEKAGADVIIKVNSMNSRYNGNFNINNKYDINGFDIKLLLKDGTEYLPVSFNHSPDIDGRYTTEFLFEDIPGGTYDLSINKYQHLKLIKEILVSNVDGVLNDGYNPGYNSVDQNTFYLVPGDINDDGYIDATDKNMIRAVKYYGKAVSSFQDPQDIQEAIKRDTNNDGYINISDYNLVMTSFAYGKTTIIIG